MKKFAVMLLGLAMALVLAGCGSQASNEITALYDEGYSLKMSTSDETTWSGLFWKDESWEGAKLVKAAMSSKQCEDYQEIEFDDEAAQKKFLGGLSDVTVTDISDKVPTEGDFAAYIGKTFADLEADGYERTGYSGDPGAEYHFFFDGPEYSVTVIPENAAGMGSLDDYSENDLRTLKIAAIEFSDFSFGILEG